MSRLLADQRDVTLALRCGLASDDADAATVHLQGQAVVIARETGQPPEDAKADDAGAVRDAMFGFPSPCRTITLNPMAALQLKNTVVAVPHLSY
jgi:hypothetical protein